MNPHFKIELDTLTDRLQDMVIYRLENYYILHQGQPLPKADLKKALDLLRIAKAEMVKLTEG